MKKVLILYPHFPPSNLAGVHRARLFAQNLPDFGWEPIVLTVNEKYYEEAPDWNLVKLLPKELRIVKVNAFPVGKFRLIGDLGLRAYFQLYKKAKQLIENEKIDFLFIPIPSFYVALLGRWLNAGTSIRYGIDYIDPWVHQFPGSEKLFSRHWFSTKLAGLLEPIAVKKASLITGVAAGYYKDVMDRNPHLKKQVVTGAMPYGGEVLDHSIMKQLNIPAYLFEKKEGKTQLVYAGAMLPKAYGLLKAIFETMVYNAALFENVEFHFIGTGKTTKGADNFNIKPLAQKYGLWQRIIFEYPQRIPYLDVLVHLNAANGIFVLGSTEPHYTPSKIYQGILSEKPILGVLHEQSSAVDVLELSAAGVVLSFADGKGATTIKDNFYLKFVQYLDYLKNFDPNAVNKEVFANYTAKNVTGVLAKLLDSAQERKDYSKRKNLNQVFSS